MCYNVISFPYEHPRYYDYEGPVAGSYQDLKKIWLDVLDLSNYLRDKLRAI